MKPRKDLVIHGIKWSIVDQFGVYGIKMLFSIAIARALSPEDYGLIALVAIFVAMGSQLTDSGFQMALIQRPNMNSTDVNTVFFFNIVMSLLVYAILFIIARPVAVYFEEPRLVAILRVASLNILIGSLSGVHLVLLSKKLDFKTQASINFSSTFASSTMGLALAYTGFNYWALLFQTLMGTLSRSVQLWLRTSWKPALQFSFKAFREMFSFGSKILLGGLVDTFFSNIYYPIIGKNYSTRGLGFYEKATSFTNLYTRQISLAIGRVAFPALANIQEDEARMKKSYALAMNIQTVFFFFATLCILPLIKPLILFALTEKWMPLVPFMQLLIIDAFFYPAFRLNINLMEAQGRSGAALLLDILKKGLMLAGLLIAVNISIEAIIYSILISSFLALVLSWFFIRGICAVTDQVKLFVTNGLACLFIFTIHYLTEMYVQNLWLSASVRTLESILILFLILKFSNGECYRVTRAFLQHSLLQKFRVAES